MHAPCDWAFEKCVKKVQATLNKAESPGYTDKQKQELTKCTSAKFACLVKGIALSVMSIAPKLKPADRHA